jgi:hypothetical protein
LALLWRCLDLRLWCLNLRSAAIAELRPTALHITARHIPALHIRTDTTFATGFTTAP